MELDLRLWQSRYRDYLSMVKGWSGRTLDTDGRELKPFFAFLASYELTSVAGLTREMLEGYRSHLYHLKVKDKSLSLSTQGVRLAAIKQFARFLYREQYLLVDVAAGVEIARRHRRLPRTILSERETVQLLNAPDLKKPVGLRDRAMLELFYSTAIRNSELRELDLDDVDWARKLVLIRKGKGDKSRVVPLGEEAELWLLEYLHKGRPQLVQESGQQRFFVGRLSQELGRQYLAKIVRQYASQVGLTKTVTPHVLRHSCATHLLKRGAGVRQLQALLGHESLDTTQIYTRVEVSDLERVIERFHPREQIEPSHDEL